MRIRPAGTMLKVLMLCGSLRSRSSNRAMLKAYETLLAGAAAVSHADIAALPHFNPDQDGEVVPASVADLRRGVEAADVLVVSTPEYAHGLPGTFKNALDWLVSFPPVAGKRAVILHVERGSSWAFDSLCEILTTMSVEIDTKATVRLRLGTNLVDDEMILARAEFRSAFEASINAVIQGDSGN
jgi:NAD(P)H-dependent FMN reductase